MENKTLFAFPYDWRLDNRETAKKLGQKIDKVLSTCGCSKVDIVAHSMGGLVTRYYIQNINANSIDQLIFMGTPQLGAPKAYLAWEAGEMGLGYRDLIIETMVKLESKIHAYSNVVKYIHEKVISLKQLLPVFKYLTDYDSGEFYDYERCKDGKFVCNDFLEDLNKTEPQNYQSVRTYSIVNDNIQTYRAFTIVDEKNKDPWEHGKPFNYPKTDGILFGSGDQTVPINSAKWGVVNQIKVDSTHADLPYAGQSEVSKILIGKPITNFGHTPVRRMLFIGIHSPADISVTTPSGKVYGAGNGDDGWAYYTGTSDPEFITIPDPGEGEFIITLTGTGEACPPNAGAGGDCGRGGKFGLEASLFSDEDEDSISYEGQIAPGQQYKFSLTNSGGGEKRLHMKVLDLTAPVTNLALEGTEQTPGEYQGTVIAKLTAEDDIASEVETVYSLDDGVTWLPYDREILFEKAGEYQMLYKSADPSGNAETIKIAKFTLVSRPAPVESAAIAEDEVGAKNSTSTEEIVVEGSTSTSSTISSPSVGREGEGVLGATTSAETKPNSRPLLQTLLILDILTMIAIIIKLFRMKFRKENK